METTQKLQVLASVIKNDLLRVLRTDENAADFTLLQCVVHRRVDSFTWSDLFTCEQLQAITSRALPDMLAREMKASLIDVGEYLASFVAETLEGDYNFTVPEFDDMMEYLIEKYNF